jgi:ACS family hexuronate transporter-like MFS transporter
MLLLASAINYMDRQTLSGLSVRITQEFGMTKTQYGQVEAVFGYAFAAGSLVFGWMADRFAVHRVYAAVLALWSLVGMATGWAQDHQGLLVFRGLLGFFEAGHWPCAVRITRSLLDERQRSMGNGLLQSGATVGAILTPLVLPMLLGSGSTDGSGAWRPPFFLLGGVGLLWLIPWFWMVRPGDLPSGGRGPVSDDRARVGNEGQSFLKVLLSGRMLAVIIVVACINTTWQVLRAWLPMFLQKGRGYTETEALHFNSAFFAAADVGCLAAGAVAVALARRGRTPSGARFAVFASCALLCCGTLAAPWLGRGPLLLAVLLAIAAGALGVFPLYHTFTQDLSDRHQGKITGAAGVAAWILPAQAQLLFGLSADRLGTMDPGFAVAGILPLMALPPLWYLHRIKIKTPVPS